MDLRHFTHIIVAEICGSSSSLDYMIDLFLQRVEAYYKYLITQDIWGIKTQVHTLYGPTYEYFYSQEAGHYGLKVG